MKKVSTTYNIAKIIVFLWIGATIGALGTIIHDINNFALVRDWLSLLILEFDAQFIYNKLTKS